jgi:hypothetical protein
MLREARTLVERLEQATLRKFTRGGTDMTLVKNVDGDAIRQDRAAGMSQAEIAAKYSVSQSTVSHHVHAKDADNGGAVRDRTGRFHAATAEATNSEVRAGNGARRAPLEDQVAALERLTEIEWLRLPVVERVRLLLSRGSA